MLQQTESKPSINQLTALSTENRELMLEFDYRICYCVKNKLGFIDDPEVLKIEAKLQENLDNLHKSGLSMETLKHEFWEMYQEFDRNLVKIIKLFAISQNFEFTPRLGFAVKFQWLEGLRSSKAFFADNPSKEFFVYSFCWSTEDVDFDAPVYQIGIDRDLKITPPNRVSR